MNSYEQEAKVGIRVITRAAALCYQVQKEVIGDGKGFLEKQDRSPVTIADYGAQALICQGLKNAFPDDKIVAEESSDLLKRSENLYLLNSTVHYVEKILGEKVKQDQLTEWIDLGTEEPGHRFWTIDPIDGTKGFLRGDQYAVAIALIDDGKVRLGLLACPNLPYNSTLSGFESGSLYIGLLGHGAKHLSLDAKQSHPIAVSLTDNPASLRFIESYEPGHSDQEKHQAILNHLGNQIRPKRMDSQAKYGLLADGKVDVYIRLPSSKTPDYREKIWDHAAGCVIVEEAGGVVSDIYGHSLDFSLGKKLASNQGIVASNGRVHQLIIDTISSQ